LNQKFPLEPKVSKRQQASKRQKVLSIPKSFSKTMGFIYSKKFQRKKVSEFGSSSFVKIFVKS
jgi:hypothetical protein